MANIGSFDVRGIKETVAGLEQFKKATARRVIERALNRAAQPIVSAAVSYAPVKTGNLRRSIRSTIIRSSPGKAAYAEAKRNFATDAEAAEAAHAANAAAKGAGLSATVRVAAFAYYAAFVELGTRAAPAHPFLGPAFRARRQAAADSIAADLKLEIEASARRIASRKIRSTK